MYKVPAFERPPWLSLEGQITNPDMPGTSEATPTHDYPQSHGRADPDG
ncbi:hypothetical protein MSHI_05820 [Mycobacterium shinjukuense]|uniref:Uncharacterized protein n=1 Tax=Mycobacterium shinjukuense TaxID=398694 RepID=A0A7I7MKJ6_9MYCO|nr:hypothetical protein MSHI_05820 [Mycobacterium shinjukuense]